MYAASPTCNTGTYRIDYEYGITRYVILRTQLIGYHSWLEMLSVTQKETGVLIIPLLRHAPSRLAVFSFNRLSSINLQDTDTNQRIGDLVAWIDILCRIQYTHDEKIKYINK